MKPIKEQFPLYTQFSVNIDDSVIGFHINNAFKFVLKSKLGSIADDIFALAEDSESRPILKKFYEDYVVQYWILLSLKTFIARQGIQVTRFGIIVMKDPQGTFEPATPADRAIILQSIENDLKAAETLMFNRLNELNWLMDSITYRRTNSTTDCGTSKIIDNSFGISAIE